MFSSAPVAARLFDPCIYSTLFNQFLTAGAAWAAFADYTRWHKPLLILTSVLALMSRISTAFVSTFAMVCLVALLSETFTAPVSILSDIAIMSAAKTVCL